MTLKTTIQNVTKKAFVPIASIMTTVTYKSVGEHVTDYDPNELDIESADISYSVSMLIGKLQIAQMSGTSSVYPTAFSSFVGGGDFMKQNYQVAKIPVIDLTPTPKQGDLITIDSIDWKVIKIEKDAAEAVWSMLIQKP
jgi:hypothetical protein